MRHWPRQKTRYVSYLCRHCLLENYMSQWTLKLHVCACDDDGSDDNGEDEDMVVVVLAPAKGLSLCKGSVARGSMACSSERWTSIAGKNTAKGVMVGTKFGDMIRTNLSETRFPPQPQVTFWWGHWTTSSPLSPKSVNNTCVKSLWGASGPPCFSPPSLPFL